MTFVHLHNHTEFSYLDGVGNVKDWIARAKELNMNALAITNHGNVDGCLEWQTECDKANIQPILGTEAYIVIDPNIKKKDDKRGHIIIFAQNQNGWQTICKLLTKANLDGFYKKPRIGFQDLLNSDLSGLVILTGCTASFINLPGGTDILLELWDRMKGSFFLEIMPHDFEDQFAHNKKLLNLHNKLDIPLIATNDCHYINEDDWETQEVLLAINSKAKWNDPKRWKFNLKELYLKSKREMQLAFRKHCFTTKQVNEALANTVKVADMCKDFRIPKQEISLPCPYKGIDDDLELEKLCRIPFMEGNKIPIWDFVSTSKEGNLYKKNQKKAKIYKDRFFQELNLIKKKNFSKYFLIFHDIIQYCKKEGIPVGPGRGSVGGSLTAFLIGITKIDPIKFHLSFARFLQEDRIDWPDIDMDFAKKDREKVRDYIVNKYGEKYTCGISTDMRLKSRAAIQAVARVFEVPEKDIGAFSKSIWQVGDEKALQSSIEKTKEGEWFAKKYPKVVKFALKLENQIRGCISGDSRLILPNENYNNERIKFRKIKHLYNEKYRGKLRMYDFDKKVFIFGDVKDIYQSGVKKVFLVNLTEKMDIKATKDHLFLTKEGWKALEEIKIGDFIATNGNPIRRIPWNKGLKGAQVAWNKGLKGIQVPWNKGLTKKDHPTILASSERMKKNNPARLEKIKKQVSERSYKHGLNVEPIKYKKKNPICEVCGSKPVEEIHHIDGNVYNNDWSNLLSTCILCHHKIHWDKRENKEIHKINPLRTIKWNKVRGISLIGKEMTYDVCMENKHQNFIANKIVVHNSGQHAAALIVSDEDLSKGTKCVLVRKGKRVVCNWSMEWAEHQGLMKLDILGLTTLSVLDESERLINETIL